MKVTIYKKLIFIFIGVLLFSNIFTSLFVTFGFRSLQISDMKEILSTSVEEAKEIYEKYGMTSSELNTLYMDKTIPLRFVDNLDGMQLSQEEEKHLDEGGTILIGHGESDRNKIPVAIAKSNDVYIVSDIGGHTIFEVIRNIILSNSIIVVTLGSLIFLLVGRMIVKPVRDITDATKKVATGDFSVQLVNCRKDELGDLIDSFNKMTKELGSIEILRNDFVSDISHEFKTPITSIEGYTKLLADCEDENRKEYIGIILAETKRLTTMATNILTINSLDYEDVSSKEAFKLDEQIRKSILLLESKWGSKDIELQVILDEVSFVGNKGLINQIWINLLDNAIKYSYEGGLITIQLIDGKDQCEFIIKDEGMGIKEEDQKHIFDKFYKADKHKNAEGTGLGLSIVKRIVDLYRGEIQIASEPDRGTRIKIVLNKMN